MSQELDQMRVRREKMEELKEAGIEPFGRRFKRDHLAQDLHDKFDQYDKEELKQIDKNKFIKPTDTYYNIVYANENDTSLTKEKYIKQTQITYDFIHLIELYMITGNIIINRYHYIIIE